MSLIRLTILGIVLIQSTAYSQSVEIEAYGDSVTAGFLSSTNVTSAPSLPVINKILKDMVNFVITKDPKYVKPHHRPDLAWPEVVKGRFTQGLLAPATISVSNAAVSGARSWDLLDQVERLKPSSAEKIVSFFFMGHNDLCQNEATAEELTDQIVTGFQEALARWDEKHEGATAYLLPVSDVHRVFSTLDGYVWYQGQEGRYTCNHSWMIRMCPVLQKKAEEKKLDNYAVPRLKAINDGLEALAKSYDQAGSRNRYVFLRAHSETPYVPSYFAIDCFHLSAEGQSALGNAVYEFLDPQLR